MFFLLWKSESPIRQTFFPSNFTSNEYIMYSQKLMLILDTTPPRVPASSPAEREYLAPFTIGILPSVLTLVGPWDVSDDVQRYFREGMLSGAGNHTTMDYETILTVGFDGLVVRINDRAYDRQTPESIDRVLDALP